LTRDWQFGSVWFHLSEDGLYAETRFPDGAVCPAVPSPADDLNTWFFHDFSHSFLAARTGREFSRTLYDVAHGIESSDYHYTEEGMVNGFVAFLLDAGCRHNPDLWRLSEFGDIGDFRRDALAMLGKTDE
jgi:hypothetical protein